MAVHDAILTGTERRPGWGLVAWLWGLMALVGQPMQAQPPVQSPVQTLRFGRATEREGLPSATVRSLLLDHTGFLWVGTDDGLARTDGRTFDVWRHRRGDPTALPNNTILSMAEDAAGRLWLGTHGGVGRFDAARETFRSWHARPGDSLAPPLDYDCRVWVGRRTGSVWLGSGAGLYRYDAARENWHRHRLPSERLGGELMTAGMEDRAGRFWCGSAGKVWVLDGRTGRVLAFLPLKMAPTELPPPMMGFMEDADGGVWAATWGDGLVALTAPNGALLPHPRPLQWDTATPHTGITDIAFAAAQTRDPVTRRRTFWVSSNRGLVRLRTVWGRAAGTDSLPNLRPGRDFDDIRADLNDEPLVQTNALLADPATGRLWLGTTAGLRWLDPGPPLFTTLPLDLSPHFAPQQIRPDRDPRTGARQYWLTSWYGNGLSLLDSSLRFVKAWPRLPIGSADADAGQVCDVVRSRIDGALWVATFGALVRFDPLTGASRAYQFSATDTASLPSSRCVTVLEDRAGRLWVGTYGHGVACLETPADRINGHFRRVRGLPNNSVTSLTEDAAGRIWIGTNGGLACASTGQPGAPLRVYLPDAANPHALPDPYISGVWAPLDGRVWFATRNGLACWRPTTDDFAQLHSGHGLPADDIRGIVPDRRGQLWLTTARGLVRVTLPQGIEHPEKGLFRLYDATNGLPASDLLGMWAPLGDGRFALGFYGRIVVVDPASQRVSRRRPRVALLGVSLFGKPLTLGRPLDSIARLDFASDEHTLTFRFAALDFTDPRNNHCEYRLDKAGDAFRTSASQWQTAGPDGTASFAHLPGGDYTLRVRARNADGLPSAHEAALHFRIRTPFWLTGWFAGLVMAASGLALALYARTVRRRAEQRTQLAQEMAELELRALRAQLQPHFIFNALNAVQELVLTGRTTDAGRYLARFARLLRLVLESADRPAVPLDTELEALRLYADIEQLRLEGLEVVFDIDPDLLVAEPAVPPMVLQPYLENAFWHGVAARPPHERRVVLRLTFGPEEATIHAQIDDTGIGRAAAARRRPTDAGRTSKGQRLTERRLTLLSTNRANTGANTGTGSAPNPSPVRITDLLDPITGAALGTRVEVWLPVGSANRT